ncbi:MAG: T9SS type A sorting domain-containing protein [Ignavibacteriae bacterium]|nr:T9SS type A sorting domain-containing protein [Ignavibacteriota bacterium]
MKYIFQIFIIAIICFSNIFSEILKPTKSIPTIQELIDRSNNGDTVLVPPGIYYENINFNGKNIVVMSYFLEMKDSSYIQSTIVSGMQQGCVVTFENGEDSTSELNGFTIRDGISFSDTLHGGGITIKNKSATTLKNLIISRNTVEDCNGAGILCRDSSKIFLENLHIIENEAKNGNGGGIFLQNSIAKIIDVKISNNKSNSGGGIFIDSSQVEINNSILENNQCENGGGGIYINSEIEIIKFNGVIVRNNLSKSKGGGIHSKIALNFPDSSNCSIFLNRANFGSTDIHFDSLNSNIPYMLSLDTVTVSEPEKYHINVINKINFHFKHAIFKSVNSDLYVSPNGSDSNNGILPISPLRTISFAKLVAKTDSANQRKINLLQGVYSNSTNNENFPIYLRDNISLVGNKVDQTILDGENKNSLVTIYHENKNVSVEKLTLQNGYDLSGSGISVSGKNILLKNLLIKNNISENDGAGLNISMAENVKLNNLTVTENNSKNQTSSGGIFINGEKISLVNCIIYNNKPKNIKLRKGILSNSELTISNSNLFGGRNNIDNLDSVKINWLSGNTDSDPMFVGGEPYDYSLTENSPCVNTGTPFLVWEGDTLINLSTDEYIGIAPDMGAIESDFLISINEDENLPTEFKLEQNYPNPFNPTTKIKYSIPANSVISNPQKGERSQNSNGLEISPFDRNDNNNVSLKIYDILGSEVRTLVNQKQNPGNYEVIFDAQNLPSGIYFYQLKTQNFSESKKFILLK